MKPSLSRSILCVLGTRPEAIKLAPVILRLQEDPRAEVKVCATGQHDVMVEQALDFYGIECDFLCEITSAPETRLVDILSSTARWIGKILCEHAFDWVIVQGDTNSALAAALAAHYMKVRVAHVEAGLRTGDRRHPYPEETNRVLIADVADVHFAPTDAAVDNLVREGIESETIYRVGNTIVDAVKLGLARIAEQPALPEESVLVEKMCSWKREGKKAVLVTLHRRETIDGHLDQVISALQDVLDLGSVRMLWSIHMNPLIRERVLSAFDGDERVVFTEPLAYGTFLRVMSEADLVLSDSGGIQEEAPTIGVPVVILREKTERPEGQRLGVATLGGLERRSILEACIERLERGMVEDWRGMPNPYGDGRASERIARILLGDEELAHSRISETPAW